MDSALNLDLESIFKIPGGAVSKLPFWAIIDYTISRATEFQSQFGNWIWNLLEVLVQNLFQTCLAEHISN